MQPDSPRVHIWVPILLFALAIPLSDVPKKKKCFRQFLIFLLQRATRFLCPEKSETATDTPGAKEALVNRFLDLILAAEKEETQREFLASLAYVDAESMRQYRQAFVYLDQPSQTELMHFLAYPHSLSRWGEAVAENDGYAHFERLKRWIASAYYNSEIGLKELGWDGTFPHGELKGCGAAGGKATAHDMNHMHSQDAAGRTGG